MFDANFYLILAGTSLTGLGMITAAGLTGWRGWLALKRHELAMTGHVSHDQGSPSVGARIEMADLKERIRKLEAIAAGVDL